jgi:hypothetical protein
VDRKVIFIHGLGDQQPGYSRPWQAAFNTYLDLPPESYLEVLWADLFQQALAGQLRPARLDALPPACAAAAANASPTPKHQPRSARPATRALTPAQRVTAARVTAEMTARVRERAVAQAQLEGARAPQPAGGASGLIADRLDVSAIPVVGGLLNGLEGLDQRIGEFVTYLVNPSVRAAVQQRFKDPLLTLAGSLDAISIISHSWGTVIAYDALLELQTTAPALRIADVFTLGCPLWLVQHYLQDATGRKPAAVARWTNIFARGDMIGSWVGPSFAVDKEFAVPNFGGQEPHGSYFLPGNEEVQRDLVAQLILRAAPAAIAVP